MPKVFVAGAAGGLGSAITNKFVDAGFEVKCLARPEDRCERLKVSEHNIVRGYVEDPDIVAQAIEGAELAVNCAALLPGARQLGYPVFRRVNVDGGLNVLAQCSKYGVRTAVFFSTISVIDHIERHIEWPQIHDYLIDYSDPYQRSKVEMEQALAESSRSFSGAVVIIRPAFVYGPGNFAVWSEAISLLRASKMVLLDGGRARLPLVYSDDIAAFVLHLAKQTLPPGVSTFILSSPEPTTMRDVFDYLAELLGQPQPHSMASWIARAAASVACVLPASLRTGRLRLLTKARVQQYSKGYDLSGVLAPVPAGFACRTGYREGFRKMLDDAKLLS
jgi:nucleoside-diphosphate-sugar epimerase